MSIFYANSERVDSSEWGGFLYTPLRHSPLHNGKFGIAPIGDQHGAGIMGDAKIWPHRHDHRLRRHSTGPKYRNFVLVHRHSVAPIRAAEILYADQFRLADMDRGAMDRRKPGR